MIFDKNGNSLFYKIQLEDNEHDTCDDFYPIRRQQGNDREILRLQNDGGSYTLNSISNEFPTPSAHSASDCFCTGKTVNQFCRLCYPLSYSPNLHENSDPTYSFISSFDTEEAGCQILNVVTVPTNQTENDEEEDEDDHISRIDTNIDHYQLCRAKTAHDSVLGKIDASLGMKRLTITYVPHLETKAIISKLDEVAKSVDLDVSTILAEQIKNPVLGTVRSWIRKKSLLMLNHLRLNNQKAYYAIANNSTDFSLRPKDNCFAIMSHRTIWTGKTLEYAFPYLFSQLAFA